MVFLLLCGVPPPVLDFTAAPPPSQQDLSKVGSAFTM